MIQTCSLLTSETVPSRQVDENKSEVEDEDEDEEEDLEGECQPATRW